MNTQPRTLSAPDPLARTAGETLAADLGDDYAEVFARVTGVPLWADEAPLTRVQRKWERFAAAVAASGSTADDVRARISAR